MNALNVFLPIIFAIFYFLLIVTIPVGSFLVGGTISIITFHNKDTNTEFNSRLGLSKDQFIKTLSFFLLFFFLLVYFLLFNVLSTAWIRATPTSNFKSEIEQAGSVVVFGFGLDKDEEDKPLPGKANTELHNWINANISKKVIIGQYGNMLAFETSLATNSFILMHKHNHNEHVNTYEAAIFALNKLDSLYKSGQINEKVVVVAHDMQLQRAVWILDKLSKENNDWGRYKFIIPGISGIPFSLRSIQFHTKGHFLYNCVELFYSRPRDFFSRYENGIKIL